MEWKEAYTNVKKPTMEDIEKFISNEYFKKLCEEIETTYQVDPSIEYSGCSMQAGWNVKYKKNGKPICTLYPTETHVICLVSVNQKSAPEVEAILPSFDTSIQELYASTKLYNGGKWLMIPITNDRILKDVIDIITIRMKK